jgi:hypothetical protein
VVKNSTLGLILGGAAVHLFCSMTFFTVVITTSFTLPRERSEGDWAQAEFFGKLLAQ